jgi:phage regulator Rha-like protein
MFELNNVQNPLTMTSREIADLTDKQHAHVMRDIRAMLAELHGEGGISRFGDTQVNPQNGQSYPVYRLPKRETLILVSGYNLAMRARIIDRWQELESAATQPTHLIPQNLPDALRLAADLAQFVNTPKGHRPMADVAIMG